MKIIDLQNNIKNTAITLGTFDGVHLGHRKIFNVLKQQAKQRHLNDVVVTFRLHPKLILNPNAQIKLLTLIDEKMQLISQQNINYLHILPFNQQMANYSAQEFVEKYLVQRLGIKHLVLGFDHRFGKNREAGYEELVKIGQKFGFTVQKVDPVTTQNGEKISSSRIRQALLQGNITLANDLLGHAYFFSGKVIAGQKLGTKLSFPTANIAVNSLKLMPKLGVYLVRTTLPDGTKYYGLLNYGIKPTVQTAMQKPTAEIHLLDYSGNLYGKTLKVEFLQRLRDERKFADTMQLKKQIFQDVKQARAIIKTLNTS